MSSRMAMTTVILPQAIRNILPALGNEGITLLKETSVAGYIGIMDLTRGGDIIRGQTYDAAAAHFPDRFRQIPMIRTVIT